jgi:hypothetical protein
MVYGQTSEPLAGGGSPFGSKWEQTPGQVIYKRCKGAGVGFNPRAAPASHESRAARDQGDRRQRERIDYRRIVLVH